jgi:hypothetical protein
LSWAVDDRRVGGDFDGGARLLSMRPATEVRRPIKPSNASMLLARAQRNEDSRWAWSCGAFGPEMSQARDVSFASPVLRA